VELLRPSSLDELDGGMPLAGTDAALLRGEDAGDAIALLDPRTPLPPCLSARLDDRGAASFANLPPGHYVVLARVAGQSLRAYAEADLAEGGSRIEIDLARRAIVGTVSHAESGPVGGAEIRIAPWDRRESGRGSYRLRQLGYLGESELFASGLEIPATAADETGTYRILGVPPGNRFDVVARSGTYWRGAASAVHVATDGTETRADLAIVPAGAIEVRLGSRPRIIPCTLAAASQEPRSLSRIVRTFSGAVEVLDGLPPGHWYVLLDAGGEYLREQVDVVAGETAFLELALP